jgi:hypothetical protein
MRQDVIAFHGVAQETYIYSSQVLWKDQFIVYEEKIPPSLVQA